MLHCGQSLEDGGEGAQNGTCPARQAPLQYPFPHVLGLTLYPLATPTTSQCGGWVIVAGHWVSRGLHGSKLQTVLVLFRSDRLQRTGPLIGCEPWSPACQSRPCAPSASPSRPAGPSATLALF